MTATYALALITGHGRYEGRVGTVLDFDHWDGMAKIEFEPGHWVLFETFEYEVL